MCDLSEVLELTMLKCADARALHTKTQCIAQGKGLSDMLVIRCIAWLVQGTCIQQKGED